MSCNSSDFVGYHEIKGLPQGADTVYPINYRTGDPLTTAELADYTAKLQVKEDYTGPVLLELSTANSTIALADTSPNITLYFNASLTENMVVYDNMIYDLEITSSTGDVTRVLEGTFSISRQVTR